MTRASPLQLRRGVLEVLLAVRRELDYLGAWYVRCSMSPHYILRGATRTMALFTARALRGSRVPRGVFALHRTVASHGRCHPFPLML